MEFLAQNLKFLREKAGLKQNRTLETIGFSPTTWNNYEKGKSKPSLEDFIKISNYFEVSETDLLHSDLSKGQDYDKIYKSKKQQKGQDSGQDSSQDRQQKVANSEELFAQLMVEIREDRKELKKMTNAAIDAARDAKEAVISSNSVLQKVLVKPATPEELREYVLEALLQLGYKGENERMIEAHRAAQQSEK